MKIFTIIYDIYAHTLLQWSFVYNSSFKREFLIEISKKLLLIIKDIIEHSVTFSVNINESMERNLRNIDIVRN